MAEDDVAGAPVAGLNTAQIELRRYEARLGVVKVVLGTFIVGLAGVLIPGAVNFYTAYFENERKHLELELSQQQAHEQYIKDFFSTAVNQDIELRIRFAEYFAHLSGKEQAPLWQAYLDSLTKLRDTNRQKISDLEDALMAFKASGEINDVKFESIDRELRWASAEIGYIPTERSTVYVQPDLGLTSKKTRLYKETTELLQRIAGSSEPIEKNAIELARYWDLYGKDLIGVESLDFARKMIEIGALFRQRDVLAAPPTPELKAKIEELVAITRDELATSQAAVQQQFQQQLQQQQVGNPIPQQIQQQYPQIQQPQIQQQQAQ